MKIFGIGLSRTGTKSLTKALNSLCFNILHFPIDEVTFYELQQGNYNLSILQNCDGITDLTIVPYYAQLYEIFPDSKFILTTRNKEDWLISMRTHWEEKVDDKSKPEYELKMNIRYFLRAAVYGCQRYSIDRLSYVYDLHYRNVVDYFRNKDNSLLIMNINDGDGWEKLCPFLGLEIPQTEFPFVKFKKQL